MGLEVVSKRNLNNLHQHINKKDVQFCVSHSRRHGSAGREFTSTLRLELGFAGAQETGALSILDARELSSPSMYFQLTMQSQLANLPAPTAASPEPAGFQQCRPTLILYGRGFPLAASAEGGTRGSQRSEEQGRGDGKRSPTLQIKTGREGSSGFEHRRPQSSLAVLPRCWRALLLLRISPRLPC